MDGRHAARRVSFGLFEADLQSGELWKTGRKIKLQSQPFKVLAVLMEQSGSVVTREELQLRLWGKDAVGDFDHSLGTAINKIRDALGDTADNPRFVETLARRGYRWIAPVTVLERYQHAESERVLRMEAALAPELETSHEEISGGHFDGGRPGTVRRVLTPLDEVLPQAPPFRNLPVQAASARTPFRLWTPAAAALAVIALLTAVLAGFHLFSASEAPPPLRIEQITRMGRIAPGMQGMENLPAGVTDGQRLYIPVLGEGRSALDEVNVRTGALRAITVPSEIVSPTLGDLSPDGLTMLVRSHLSPESEQPFWLVPTSGGSALRLPNGVGHDATWMPDGKSVLLASGNRLIVTGLEDGKGLPLATLPGRAFWLRWSPDGELLRFTLLDPIAHTMRLGELRRDGTGLRMLLNDWSGPGSECCGIWTGDGRNFVFQSNHGNSRGSNDLWRLTEKKTSNPVRVTNGPLSYVAPIGSRLNNEVYFLGLEALSTLQLVDRGSGQLQPAPAFLTDAARVEYSRDGRWVTWTDEGGRQWRAHADGSETLQLTSDAMQVFAGHWSPDGKRLALMARDPGKAWRIYIVGAEGGFPEPVLEENRNEADPSWSPDGQKMIFGRLSDVMGKEENERELEVLDLQSRRVVPVPGSAGFFSPRWSPDGRFIAALSLDQRLLMLFDARTSTWQTLAATTAADPVWSNDSQWIYFHASLAESQPIYRVSVRGGQPVRVAALSGYARVSTADSFFCGLTPDEVPIVRTRTATGNVYSMSLRER